MRRNVLMIKSIITPSLATIVAGLSSNLVKIHSRYWVNATWRSAVVRNPKITMQEQNENVKRHESTYMHEHPGVYERNNNLALWSLTSKYYYTPHNCNYYYIP